MDGTGLGKSGFGKLSEIKTEIIHIKSDCHADCKTRQIKMYAPYPFQKHYSLNPSATVVVAAPGYLVDMYDLLMFNIVRIPSLKSLNLSDEKIRQDGVMLLNCRWPVCLQAALYRHSSRQKRTAVDFIYFVRF